MVVASVGILAAVAYFFVSEFATIRSRETLLAKIRFAAEEGGPCAGLMMVRSVGWPKAEDVSMLRLLASLRTQYGREILGEFDGRGRKAMLAADAEGLLGRTLCEQIKLSHDVGDTHPVLALLRFTREGGNPCQEQDILVSVLAGLGSHRSAMLHALMKEVRRLRCLSPAAAQKVAKAVINELQQLPRFMDDLEVPAVASFINRWAPRRTAQFACRVEVREQVSRIANAVGCTPATKENLLTHYRSRRALPRVENEPERKPGAEVLILREQEDRCEVLPVDGSRHLFSVSCDDLELLSPVHLAVRIEPIAYGMVRADLISGLITYDGRRGRITASRQDPNVHFWFGYTRSGMPVGRSGTVDLQDLAGQLGEKVPSDPLRTFCRNRGARYCYDVDWAHVVKRIEGEPVVFLSRPLDGTFLEEIVRMPEAVDRLFMQAFDRGPQKGAIPHVYRLRDGAHLVVETLPDGIDLRWRLSPTAPWAAQSFGRGEGGSVPPSARLFAAFDLQADGRPELVVQRTQRGERQGELADLTDEVHLMHLAASGDHFETITQLTVHEY